MLRSVILPLVLYRTEHICPTYEQCLELQALFDNFLLSFSGISLAVCQNTLYSRPRFGLGVPYLPILIPTRSLDMLQKAAANLHLHTTAHIPIAHLNTYKLAKLIILMHAPTHLSFAPHNPSSWSSVEDMQVQKGRVNHPHQYSAAFSDGSLITSSGVAGAAALLPDGSTLQARCPGRQSIYKSELIGLCLAAKFAPPSTQIYCDSKGAVRAALGTRKPVREHFWVTLVRDLIQRK